MITECKFDKSRDICEVVPYGYVDLVDALRSGQIPSSLVVDVSNFDADNVTPNSIIGKPDDTFAAARMVDSVLSHGRLSSKSTNVAAASAAATSVAATPAASKQSD